MVHQCFFVVVLASIISSGVVAAPTPQASAVPEQISICDDSTVSWEDKRKASCPVCEMRNLPGSLRLKWCAEDGPGTHGYADGVWRRDGAALAEAHTLPYELDPEAIVPVHTDAKRLLTAKPFSTIRPFPVGPGPVILPEPIVEPVVTEDEVHTASKRDSVQSIDTVDKSLPVEAIATTSQWTEIHHKAGDVYRREDMSAEAEPQTSSLPADAVTSSDVVIHEHAPIVWRKVPILGSSAIVHPQAEYVSGVPKLGEKREVATTDETQATFSEDPITATPDKGPEVSEDQTTTTSDIIIHESAPIVWRRNVAFIATTHTSAAEVSNGHLRDEKRSAHAVPPPEFFDNAHLPLPHEPLKPAPPSFEDGDPLLPLHRRQTVNDILKEQNYTLPLHTPAVTHPLDTDVHRRAEKKVEQRSNPDLDFKDGKTPVSTPSLTHILANDIHRRGEVRVQAREWVG